MFPNPLVTANTALVISLVALGLGIAALAVALVALLNGGPYG